MKATSRSNGRIQVLTPIRAGYFLLFTLFTLILLFLPAPSLGQLNETASAWAARLSKDYDMRTALEISNSREPQSTADAMIAWNEAIENRIEKVHALDLMNFVNLYSPIWNGSKVDPTTLNKLTARAKLLNREQIQAWQNALKSIQGKDVSDLWAIGILVTIDSIFRQGEYNTKQSEALRARLAALPPIAVDLLATKLKTAKAVAAGKMVSQEALFKGGSFNQKYFDEAMKMLDTTLTKK